MGKKVKLSDLLNGAEVDFVLDLPDWNAVKQKLFNKKQEEFTKRKVK